MKKSIVTAAVAVAVAGGSSGVFADDTAAALEMYRQMIQDSNPAELYEMAGEELWFTARGPKNATLEQCDLGLGPGVVEGAYAQMPRYFSDTDRVQDLESRLMTCIETLQGIPSKEIIDGRFRQGERGKVGELVAYVVGMSRGDTINVNLEHPRMKEMYELGKQTFFYRSGPMDFACSTCHAVEGKRIRMQDLPDLTKQKGAAAGWGTWPAYRVSNSQFWTMQHRLWDCYRQQRTAEPIYGSEVTVALSVYMAGTANGGEIKAPSAKR
jgi:sulfur-oxidizing protein SoxA